MKNKGYRYTKAFAFSVLHIEHNDSHDTLFIPDDFTKIDYNYFTDLQQRLFLKIFLMEVDEYSNTHADNLIEQFRKKFPRAIEIATDEIPQRVTTIDAIATKHKFTNDERETLEIYLDTGEIEPSGSTPILKKARKLQERRTRDFDSIPMIRYLAWQIRNGKSYKDIISDLIKQQRLPQQLLQRPLLSQKIHSLEQMMSKAYSVIGKEALQRFMKKE